MRDHMRTLARYNRWANERLYEACGALDDDAYRADRGAFFGSIHRPINSNILLKNLIHKVVLLGHSVSSSPCPRKLGPI